MAKATPFFAPLQTLDPADGHFRAIGVGDGARHARDLIVARKQADIRSIADHWRAQQKSFGADGHENMIRGRGPGGDVVPALFFVIALIGLDPRIDRAIRHWIPAFRGHDKE